jgi:hypothetical protein
VSTDFSGTTPLGQSFLITGWDVRCDGKGNVKSLSQAEGSYTVRIRVRATETTDVSYAMSVEVLGDGNRSFPWTVAPWEMKARTWRKDRDYSVIVPVSVRPGPRAQIREIRVALLSPDGGYARANLRARDGEKASVP